MIFWRSRGEETRSKCKYIFFANLLLRIFLAFGLTGNKLNVCLAEWRRYAWITLSLAKAFDETCCFHNPRNRRLTSKSNEVSRRSLCPKISSGLSQVVLQDTRAVVKRVLRALKELFAPQSQHHYLGRCFQNVDIFVPSFCFDMLREPCKLWGT